MIKKVAKVAAGALMTAAVLAPFAVFAQQGLTPPPPQYNTRISGYNALITFIDTVIGGWLFGLLMALAVIFILYAAFLYLTAGGDETKVGKAKSIIVYAVIAIVIALLAKAIVTVVLGSLQ